MLLNLTVNAIFYIQINFSGGEPFIIDKGRFLGEMVRHCKEDLDVESVTVVTNGSKVQLTLYEASNILLDSMDTIIYN